MWTAGPQGYLTWVQFSTLWWNRMYVQLAGQALCQKEVLSNSDTHTRWRMLSRLAATEGQALAKAFDEATWACAVAKATAGARLSPGYLTEVDEQLLAELRRKHAADKAKALREPPVKRPQRFSSGQSHHSQPQWQGQGYSSGQSHHSQPQWQGWGYSKWQPWQKQGEHGGKASRQADAPWQPAKQQHKGDQKR